MKSPKDDFLGVLREHKGVSCFLIVEAGYVKLRLWAKPDSVPANADLTFLTFREEERVEIDLSQATSFPVTDVVKAPTSLANILGEDFFVGAVSAIIENRLSVTVLLPSRKV